MSSISAFFGSDAPQGDGAPSYSVIRAGEFDVIDALPAEAQDALTALRERVDDIHADVSRASDKMFDEGAAAEEAKTNFLVISDPNVALRMGNGRTLAEDHPEFIRRKAAMEKAQARHRETIAKKEALGQRWHGLKRLLTDVESYVATAGNLTAVPAPQVTLPRIDRLAAEVEKVRKDIAELKAEKHAVNSAAYPSAEVKARARREIEALAEAGRPNVLRMIDHGPAEGIFWPDVKAQSRILGGMAVPLPGDVRHAGEELPGGHLALLAFLCKDTMLAAVMAEIDAVSEDSAALSSEQRVAKIAELDARILKAERIEAALVAASSGSVDFREDADPRAVLGVDGPAPRED